MIAQELHCSRLQPLEQPVRPALEPASTVVHASTFLCFVRPFVAIWAGLVQRDTNLPAPTQLLCSEDLERYEICRILSGGRGLSSSGPVLVANCRESDHEMPGSCCKLLPRHTGMGNRAVELMAQRALQRVAFKGPIASQGAFRCADSDPACKLYSSPCITLLLTLDNMFI